jgi:hypothetical protein
LENLEAGHIQTLEGLEAWVIGMRIKYWVYSLLAVWVLLTGCAPAAKQDPKPQFVEVVQGSSDDFKRLLEPFNSTLSNLGVKRITSYRAYKYTGNDDSGFIQAINDFYLTYPGFCPLVDNAFYPAQNGIVFLTLASNNSPQIRGFLYDQSQKPRLTYAYFEASGESSFSSISCKTAQISN